MNNEKLSAHINQRLEDWKCILKKARQVNKQDYISESITVLQELNIIKELMEDNDNVTNN